MALESLNKINDSFSTVLKTVQSDDWKLARAFVKATNDTLVFVFHLTGVDKTANAVGIAVLSVVTPVKTLVDRLNATGSGVLNVNILPDLAKLFADLKNLKAGDVVKGVMGTAFKVGEATEGFLAMRELGLFTQPQLDNAAKVSGTVMGYSYLLGGSIFLGAVAIDSTKRPKELSGYLFTKQGRDIAIGFGDTLKGLIGMDYVGFDPTAKLALNVIVSGLKFANAYYAEPKDPATKKAKSTPAVEAD